jgi:probable HAF family extracellular repeat protein
MVNLGSLGGGLSRATATSHDGSVVVGTSLTTGSSGSAHAFIWTARCGMRDLQTALKNQGADIPSGWILQTATDVSEGGTVITGWGVSPPVPGSTAGQTQPWRATLPAPC